MFKRSPCRIERRHFVAQRFMGSCQVRPRVTGRIVALRASCGRQPRDCRSRLLHFQKDRPNIVPRIAQPFVGLNRFPAPTKGPKHHPFRQCPSNEGCRLCGRSQSESLSKMFCCQFKNSHLRQNVPHAEQVIRQVFSQSSKLTRQYRMNRIDRKPHCQPCRAFGLDQIDACGSGYLTTRVPFLSSFESGLLHSTATRFPVRPTPHQTKHRHPSMQPIATSIPPL